MKRYRLGFFLKMVPPPSQGSVGNGVPETQTDVGTRSRHFSKTGAVRAACTQPGLRDNPAAANARRRGCGGAANGGPPAGHSGRCCGVPWGWDGSFGQPSRGASKRFTTLPTRAVRCPGWGSCSLPRTSKAVNHGSFYEGSLVPSKFEIFSGHFFGVGN